MEEKFHDPEFVRILGLELLDGAKGIYIKRKKGKIDSLLEIHGHNLPMSALMFSPHTIKKSPKTYVYKGENVEEK